jgi:hypothetical protein
LASRKHSPQSVYFDEGTFRLEGKSHLAIAHKFACGATSGKGSRVFIERNKVFSFGHHFALATRKEEGDWGCGV